ncbi:lantibiotic dehydratase [Streptomyces parvus]|uniref:Lantibiotic dehydratase n=1 Tax=Streptomyces parvus TaxID=66428 RepID=A0A5D4JC46_9ACTN|nr:lantibiotic dehydratase [Streptomyces parvus]
MSDPGTALRWTVPHGPTELSIELLAPCLLRTSGFPASLLEGAADEDTLELARLADARAREREAAQQDFLTRRWPALRAAARTDGKRHPAWRSLLRAHRRIESGQPLDDATVLVLGELGGAEAARWAEDWNTRLAEDEKLRADTKAALLMSTLRSYRYTAQAVDDERMRHAVFVSNPSFFRTALHRRLSDRTAKSGDALPDRGTRRTLATAHRYLRRFTTKCETVSFFGPILFAGLDPSQPEPVRMGEPGVEQVIVEASTWLTELLAQRVAADMPPERRRIRRSPLFAEPADGAQCLERAVDAKRFRVSAPALRLWRVADGAADLGELAAQTGMGLDAALEAVRALGPALIVTGAQPLAATELAALGALAGHDPTGPAAELDLARDAYAAAPWPQRADIHAEFQQRVQDLGGETRRGAGQHYADREVLFEDRTSPYSERVDFGGPTLDGLRQALTAVLPLCHLSALLSREDARDTLRAELRGSATRLIQLAAAPLPADQPRTDRLREVLRRLVTAEPPDAEGAVHLTREGIDRATAELWQLIPAASRYDAALPSPDLMAVGTDPGRATWLLSELHDDCSSIYGGLESRAHSDPAALWADFVRRAGEHIDPAQTATIVSRRRSAHVTPELPGVSIELSGLSAKSRDRTAPVAQATVAATGDALEVLGERRRLYPGDLASPLHRAVSLPAVVQLAVDAGPHTPRIVIDGVVYQRARWRTELPEHGTRDSYEAWLGVQRWRLGLGLPRRVFVRHPDEPKPLHVDFADPLSVADLARLGAAECVLTEMLPGPGQLWWHADGGHQCAEFRLGCVVQAGRREEREERQEEKRDD